MTTPLNKPLRRELGLKKQRYVITITPESVRITLKGHRKGTELRWEDLVSGDAALAVALTASVTGKGVRPGEPAKRRRPRARPSR